MSSRLAMLGVGVAALLLVGAGVLVVRGRGAEAPTTRQAVIGQTHFTLLSNYFRPSAQGGRTMNRLDLAAFFPDFTPAGEAGDIDEKTDLYERFQKLVFITVSLSDGTLEPADRPSRLYARFLEPDQWSHPGGLVASAFQAGSPFEGQELYFVAPEGRAFAARCGKPDQAQKTPNSCTYDFRMGDLDVELRFSAALLSEWEKLNAGARGLIEAARR
jgi:hypothetical protein